MGILDSLRGPDVEAFAKRIAGEVAARYPAKLERTPQGKISVNRVTLLLEEIFASAESFKNEHRLGWLQKSKLGNSFLWELKEMGYSEQFSKMATEGLIVYITRQSAAGADQPKTKKPRRP